MMKKLKQTAVVLFGLAAASLANAANNYAVIDIQRIVENSTYLKQQNADLKESIKPSVAKVEQLGQELEAMQQNAQKNGKGMKEAEVKKWQEDYRKKADDFNSAQKNLQAKVQSTLQKMNATLENRVEQTAEQLRQENKLDFILNKNSVVAFDAKYDLTDKMIQKVNAIK